MNLMEAYIVARDTTIIFLCLTLLGIIIANPILQWMILIASVSYIIQMIIYLKILNKL